MSVAGLIENNPDKAWANLYLNNLTVYGNFALPNVVAIDSLQVGQDANAAVVEEVNEFVDVVRLTNAAPVDGDFDIPYRITQTKTTNKQHWKYVFDFGSVDIQSQAGTDAITSAALPVGVRPPYGLSCACNIIDTNGQQKVGSVYLPNTGVLNIKAQLDNDITSVNNAFAGGVIANFGPIDTVVLEYIADP